MKELLKNKFLFIIKYCIGFLLLGWILWRVDRKEMVRTLLHFKAETLLLIFILAALNISAQFLRWRYLIERHSVHFRYKDLLPSFFAGFAFRLMVPGGHAEITKVFLLPGQKRGKVVAFGIEKFFQTYIKLIFVLLVFPVFYPAYRWPVWLLAAVGILAYFFLPALWNLKFMERFREKELRYQRIFFHTLLYSLTIYCCLIAQYYVLLNETGVISVWNTVLAVTMIWGSALLPISVSGLGVRENTAVFFLALFNISAAAATGIALLIFFINIILPALIGGIFIFRRRKELKEAGGALKTAAKTIVQKSRSRFRER